MAADSGTARKLDARDLDAEVARVAASVAGVCVGLAGRERVRIGLAELLRCLDEDLDLAWAAVASPEVVERRRAVADPALVAAIGDARTVEDGWRMVHERLWRAERPRLGGLLLPLMAMIALRTEGLDAVAAEMQG